MKIINALSPALCGFITVASLLPAQQHGSTHWVGSWACSQQIPELSNSLPADDLQNATLRQIVHLSLGGGLIRVHISNVFGIQPLHLISVHIAKPTSSASSSIDPTTDRALTFDSAHDVTIPAGTEYVSDAVAFTAAPLSDLAVTIQYDVAPNGETGHPGSRATSYLAHDVVPSLRDLLNAKRFDHWFQISGVDVVATAQTFAIVAIGDSITDGHGATTNGNDRWPDILAARLQASHPAGVLNQGIGGNHLLTDGLGLNALARFDRDVLAQPGTKYVLVLEGVNDLGGATRLAEIPQAEHDVLVARIIGAYRQMIERAHAQGLRIFGATITPYIGSDYYHPGPMSESDRQKINQWIRAGGHFDAVVDFDRAIADPTAPGHMLPAFDSGDHLHPSPAGYKAMANAVPLDLFN